MRPYALDHRRRGGVPQPARVDDVDPIHLNAQLAEAALVSAHVEGFVRGQLRRHPGGNEGFAGSDRTVVNIHATHPSLPIGPDNSERRELPSITRQDRCIVMRPA